MDSREGTPEIVGTAMLVSESTLEQAVVDFSKNGVECSTIAAEDRIVFTIRGGNASRREEFFANIATCLGSPRVRRGDVTPSQLICNALSSTRTVLAVAESCTGGLVGKLITDIPGSSRVFWGAMVTYSNRSKCEVLDVPEDLISRFGSVSCEVVEAMSTNVLSKAGVDIGVAVSGIAGPQGGSEAKPCGTVWVSVRAANAGSVTRRFLFTGPRNCVRRKAAIGSLLLAEGVLLKTVVFSLDEFSGQFSLCSISQGLPSTTLEG